jgi:hypothetical protein
VIESFALFLQQLSSCGIGLIATLRNDFYPHYQKYLAELFTAAHRYDLPKLSTAALEYIIQSPADLADLTFEELPEQGNLAIRLRDDVTTQADAALPLLEFCLTQLYEASRDDYEKICQQTETPPPDTRLLTHKAYEDMGGLRGSIGKHAEGVYQKLYQEFGTKAENALSQLLGDLTTITQKATESIHQIGNYGFISQPIFLEDYPEKSVERKLIEAFSKVRLFILDGGADKPIQVRVTHTALLTHWSSAQTILQDLKEYIALRERIKQDCNRWHTMGKPTDLLLPAGKRLAEGKELLEEHKDKLLGTKDGENLIAYIDASSQAEQARKDAELAYQQEEQAKE